MRLGLGRTTESQQAANTLARQTTAAAIWSDTLSKLTNSILWWRLIALVLAVGVVSFGHVALKAKDDIKLIAFIDRIDTDGRLLWAGRPESFTPDDLFISKAVVQWILHVRSRPGDVRKPGNLAILNANWESAYALTDATSEAGVELARYIEEENPMKYGAAVEVTLNVEVISRYRRDVMDTPKDHIFRVEWSEEWKINGAVKKKPRFQADVWVELRPDQHKGQTQAMTQREVNRRDHPGVFIVRYQWHQLGGA